MDKVYELQQDFVHPFGKTHKGTIHTYEEWLYTFPKLKKEDLDIKTDWFKEKEQPKEWEILQVISDDVGIIGCPSKGIIDMTIERKGERIHSVKRTSDNEVFTIGDTVTMVGEITGFQIDDNKIKALTHAKGNWQFLNSISHIKKEQPVSTDTFVWDEEMAKEYGKFCILNKSWLQWEDFKQSKSTPKEEKIIIESILCIIASEPATYEIKANKLFPPNSGEKIKKAIEFVLNGQSNCKITEEDIAVMKIENNLYTEHELLDYWEDIIHGGNR